MKKSRAADQAAFSLSIQTTHALDEAKPRPLTVTARIETGVEGLDGSWADTMPLLEVAIEGLHGFLSPSGPQEMLQNIDCTGLIRNIATGRQSNPLVAYCLQNFPLSATALGITTNNYSHALEFHQEGAVIADIVDNNQPLFAF